MSEKEKTDFFPKNALDLINHKIGKLDAVFTGLNAIQPPESLEVAKEDPKAKEISNSAKSNSFTFVLEASKLIINYLFEKFVSINKLKNSAEFTP